MNKPIIKEMFADNGEHSHWELINPDTKETLWTEKILWPLYANADGKTVQIDIKNDFSSTPVKTLILCKECKADLTLRGAINRLYTSKDNGSDRYGTGHYNENGDYEPDKNTNLSDGRFDLHDGSDTCKNCLKVVG